MSNIKDLSPPPYHENWNETKVWLNLKHRINNCVLICFFSLKLFAFQDLIPGFLFPVRTGKECLYEVGCLVDELFFLLRNRINFKILTN